MRAIRTEKQPHIQFKREIDKTVQPIRRLSAAATTRVLNKLGLRAKPPEPPPLDANGQCSACGMYGHDASVHKKNYSSKEVVSPCGVIEEMDWIRDEYRKTQYHGRYHLPHKGRTRLRQKGKLTTGINL